MPPAGLATIATVQAAITALLTTREPEFIRFGYAMFVSFATIVLVWQGVRMMFGLHHHGLGDHMFDFAKVLLFISFGFAMIAFYEKPIPGFGVSFSNLITDQTSHFANILDARSLQNTFAHLDELWSRFLLPDTWGIFANLIYWLLLIVIQLAKAFSLGVVSFGLIASAVCALLGPIFVPFFIVPQLDWLFWGWLKAFIQYSFIPVVALAYLMIGEKFIFAFVSTVPLGVTEAMYPLYILQALVIVGTFAFGIVLVPFLTSSIFSGHAVGATGGFLGVLTRGK